ncbi:MAG: VanZ family protein [Lachnospiraceae bacterium]|nr:VanZ family protein [Lachnospiraceae bacterium]
MSIPKNPWRWIFLGTVILWMGFIFWMSALPAIESQSESDALTLFFQRLFFRNWEALPEKEYLEAMGHLAFFIRKAAHFSEFALLGMCLSLFFTTFETGFVRRFLLSLLIGVLYAVSDEIHQIFVETRDGTVFDVCIDSAGVLLGCLLISGILAMVFLDRDMKSEKTPSITTNRK